MLLPLLALAGAAGHERWGGGGEDGGRGSAQRQPQQMVAAEALFVRVLGRRAAAGFHLALDPNSNGKDWFELRDMPQRRIRRMQQALLAARPSFLWHTDPSRPSAVDQILVDLCEAK